MPRLRYIEESEKTPAIRAMIESAERTGAPDPRVVSIMTRSEVGAAWVECWNKVLYTGLLPHKLKEMCRIRISVAHQCGYCSTVRSKVAQAEGLTEDMIADLFDYEASTRSTRTRSMPICRSSSATRRSSNSACCAPRPTGSANWSSRSM